MPFSFRQLSDQSCVPERLRVHSNLHQGLMIPNADEDNSKHNRSDQQRAEQDLECQVEIFSQIFPSQAQAQRGLPRRLWAKPRHFLGHQQRFSSNVKMCNLIELLNNAQWRMAEMLGIS